MILLVPSFDVRSDGPIRLGAVLSDPAYTKDKLRLRPSVKIPEYQIRSERMQGWKGVKSNRRLSRGLFTFYLSLNLGRNEETQELQAEELITKTFTPTREYITQSVQRKEVEEYVRRKVFRTGLYMITAVKLAIGLRVVSSTIYSTGAEIGIRNLASASSEISKSTTHSFDVRESVFAYSVRRIIYDRSYKKDLGKFEPRLLRADVDLWDQDEREPNADVTAEEDNKLAHIDVIGLEKRDLDADDLGALAHTLVDENTGREVESVLTTEIEGDGFL